MTGRGHGQAWVRPFLQPDHLLNLQASKGDKDKEEARKEKQDLMMDLAGSKTTIWVQGKPKQQKNSRLGDDKPPPESPQSRGHELQLDCRSSARTRKINLLSNQKGYDNSETNVGKLSTRRIQIWLVYFYLGNI